MKTIISGVSQQILKWAYTSAWIANDPGSFIPPFREDVISTTNEKHRYPPGTLAKCQSGQGGYRNFKSVRVGHRIFFYIT